MIEIMEKRTSVRTYSRQMPERSVFEQMERIIARERKGPFGNKFTFSLFRSEGDDSQEIGKLTSYGMIKNASYYFGGYSGGDDRSLIDYGYCFEEVVLELTALDLGTCWLGGTFSRGYVANKISLPEGMVIPAISPVGLRGEKKSLTERASRLVAGAKNRKPHNKILFNYSSEEEFRPLDLHELPAPVDEIVEAVRFAPSASNKQPWRIVKQDDLYHFYGEYDRNYNRLFHHFRIQALDMGIALCHFRKGAEVLRLGGKFSYADPHFEGRDWTYILSWKTGTR